MRPVLATAAAALVLAALSVTAPVAADIPATDTTAGDRIPRKYLEQQVTWTLCHAPTRTRCAHILTPLDWHRPATSPAIRIAVSKTLPKGSRGKRLLMGNPGGPGAPGLGMAPYLAGRPGAKDHLAVGFDVRGTGASTALECPRVPQSTADYRDRRPATLDRVAQISRITQSRCRAGSGALLRYVDTYQTVHDVNLIRALLGYPQTDYLGFSGGTWLGAYYQKYFPKTVGRFVLDSNTDFTGPWSKTVLAQPQAAQRRFAMDFQPWAASYHSVLHLGRRPAAVNAFYEDLRADLVRRPLIVTVQGETVIIDGNFLDGSVTASMYSGSYFPNLGRSLGLIRRLWDQDARVETPDPILRELISRADGSRFGSPSAMDASTATFTAITCNDTPWPRGRAVADGIAKRLGTRYPLIGWAQNRQPCFYWHRAPLIMPTPDGAGIGATLMVQSVHDPATNASLAYDAHAAYAGSVLITVVKEGDHGVYGRGNRCVDDRVDKFLATGVGPAHDLVCTGQPLPDPTARTGAGSVQDQLAAWADRIAF